MELIMRKTLFTASVLAVALAAPFAQAHQAGDVILRAGAITVDPREETSRILVDRGALAGTNLGGKASLDSDTQLGLNFAYMLTDHFGIELLAATPFSMTCLFPEQLAVSRTASLATSSTYRQP